MGDSKSDLAPQDLGAAAVAPPDGASRLLRLGEFAREPGADKVADEARELASRVAEGRFYLAFVGQVKRGNTQVAIKPESVRNR